MDSYYSGGMGAACYGCGKGGKQGVTNPASVNKNKLAGKYGWKVRAGGKYTSVGDPILALDVYCFQHAMEQAEELKSLAKGDIKATDLLCGGTCSTGTKMKECYNRDGMLGKRTMQLISNARVDGKTNVGGLVLADIILPSTYNVTVKKPPPPVPDEDARADIVTGTGPASQRHKLIKKKTLPPKNLTAGAGESTSWWWIAALGVAAVGAVGYYKYDTDPAFRSKIKRYFG